ncbi:hypothetical protein ANDO1_1719 [plant metagenome]|uniref:Phage protein n=1 Tax=plant metagenome TaxID=1297885 RepID=A0A484P393_9ZZZZ
MTAPVTCVTCSNFDLRKAGKLAPHGFGACAHRQVGCLTSNSYPRSCHLHKPAAPALVDSRVRWLEKNLPSNPSTTRNA